MLISKGYRRLEEYHMEGQATTKLSYLVLFDKAATKFFFIKLHIFQKCSLSPFFSCSSCLTFSLLLLFLFPCSSPTPPGRLAASGRTGLHSLAIALFSQSSQKLSYYLPFRPPQLGPLLSKCSPLSMLGSFNELRKSCLSCSSI